MKPKMLTPLLALVVATGVAYGQEKKAGQKPQSVTVRMHAESKSRESGTARLTAVGDDKTRVEISLKGAPKGTPQPAHIHEGTCKNLNPQPKYGLENVVDGKSTSEVPVALAELRKGTFAVNVHKSTDDIKTYVSCGAIPKARGAKKAAKAGK